MEQRRKLRMNKGLIPLIRLMRRLKAYWMELIIKMINLMIRLRKHSHHCHLSKDSLGLFYLPDLKKINKEGICQLMLVSRKITLD